MRVYDAATGAPLARYVIDGAFTTDVVVTRDAAYVTESFTQQLYVIPLRSNGTLPPAAAVQTIPLTGDISYTDQPNPFNANGIVATGGQLVIGQLNTGKLFSLNPTTGLTREIDLGGENLFGADGITLRGRTLFVTTDFTNSVAVVRLSGDLSAGRVVQRISDPLLDEPTSNTVLGNYLYVLNSHIQTPPTPTTTYAIVRIRLP